ncbi:nucleotidyltransferase family protein [bacterium SCSIO 12696]|nr:nucleotidyltransferase family protein [bacterium SCSIO 12696]
MKLRALLMAAGRGSRFGGLKQLAEVSGQPMVTRSLAVYQQVLGNQVSLVLGCQAATVAQSLADTVAVIHAKRWQQGLGASIGDAIKQLPADTSHVLIGLADQVAIQTGDLKRLMDASQQHPDKMIAAFYQGQVGAPVIFPRRYFADLKQLNEDKGAKSILQQHSQNLIAVELSNASIDIDTSEQLNSCANSKNSN